MTSTVDTISSNINTKFSKILEILDIYNSYKLKDDDDIYIINSIKCIKDLYENYILSTVDILSDYYSSTDEKKKTCLRNDYVKLLYSGKYISELNRVFSVLSYYKNIIYKFNDTQLIAAFQDYDKIHVDESFSPIQSDICTECNIAYDVEEKTSEYNCKNCGKIEKISGVVFEDDQFFYQEGQRTKHSKYDPIKHAKCWLDRIQAKCTTEIPKELLDGIRKCIIRDKIWVKKITCDNIRGYLKQLKQTSYNVNIPLIRRLITGIEPPQLTDTETRLVYMHFSNIVQIYNTIKSDPNCPYHPFFLYKILEQILKGKKHEERRKLILECIHLQERNTLIENDNLWYEICNYIPEFKKIPTNYT